jgi:aminoglycoside phosphotransferase (APT) family kinase protein
MEALAAAVRRRYGPDATIRDVEVATLGGSNRTVLFDLVAGGERRRLVSRQETYVAEATPFHPTRVQFAVMALAQRAGLAVPEPVFEYDEADGLGHGFVTAFVAGETMPRRLLGDERFRRARTRMIGDLAGFLARLHALPTDAVPELAQFADSADPIAAVTALYDRYDEAHPAIDVALRWLHRHRPPPRPARLLHGDLRTGNLMVDEDGLAGVLDWECTHLGSPAEELGWLCTRSWRFGHVERHAGGFGTRSELLDAYHAAGGDRIEADEVRYWEVFGLLRWAVLNMWQAFGHVHEGRRSPAFAACGRNTAMIEYDLLMTLSGRYD